MNTNQNQPSETPLFIEKLVHGGQGLGHLAEGKIALVTGALPGETVLLRVTQRKQGYVEGLVRDIVAAAPERISPACPYYADCGGCNLQHADLAAQLRMKTAIVAECLTRAGLNTVSELAALPAPEAFGSRHRLRLHLDAAGRPGFFQRASKRLVPVQRCLLASAGINRALAGLATSAKLCSWFAGRVQELEFAECPESGRVVLVLYARKTLNAGARKEVALRFAREPCADCILWRPNVVLYQRDGAVPVLHQHFVHSGLEYRLSWPAGTFFQANTSLNGQLVALVLEAVRECQPQTVLDLFCGSGNFSVPFGLAGFQVTGVEWAKASVQWAENNARQNGLRHFSFLVGDVNRKLEQLVTRGQRFDCVVLDPPRTGLGKATALLPKLAPRRIVSISCDPATHARDLGLLLAVGYRLERLTVVDMFPQTHHIESVAVLNR